MWRRLTTPSRFRIFPISTAISSLWSCSRPQGSEQIQVNGQPFSATGYELDGTDNQDPILGIIVINPNIDSITETRVSGTNYDAEFFYTGAGVMNVSTKSGTNELHGSAFEF